MNGPSRTDPEAESPAASRRFSLRRHRLKSSDFARAYAEGSRARGALMTVVVRRNGLDVSRLGLSVGKRCQRRAVLRNRVRRVFRESFRLSRAELPPGLDVVLIASTPGIRPDLEETRAELVRMCRKALRRLREKEAREDGRG